ncbi:DUF4932 domain-containing protein, partial [bacterium]
NQNITVDPRIELISIVLFLANEKYADLNTHETDYRIDVQEHFNQFSNHQAVILCRELHKSGFHYDAPPALVLYHSDLPDFKQETEYPDRLVQRAGSIEKLNEFTSALRDFVKISQFEDFFNAHQSYYNVLTHNVNKILQDQISFKERLEDFYGESKHSYQIILGPLIKGGGYGPQIIKNNKKEIYCIMGPQSQEGIQKNLFGDLTWFAYIPYHEFSHSYVNPVTDQHRTVLEEYDGLFTVLKDTMRSQAYHSWITCINEHLVRTNVVRLFVKIFPDSFYIVEPMLLAQERGRGFIFIDELNNLMKEYEQDREKYPDYQSFYPRIIQFFREKFLELENEPSKK